MVCTASTWPSSLCRVQTSTIGAAFSTTICEQRHQIPLGMLRRRPFFLCIAYADTHFTLIIVDPSVVAFVPSSFYIYRCNCAIMFPIL
ncbi:hypothetical protein V6N13_052177 [Hibiscus sabdariffa]